MVRYVIILNNMKLFRKKDREITPLPKYRDYEWVKKVICSCENWAQLNNAHQLSVLWKEMYGDRAMFKLLDDMITKIKLKIFAK